MKTGLTAAKAGFPGIVSLSIDTWGVDYILLQGNEEIHPVYAYWDSRTDVGAVAGLLGHSQPDHAE